MYYYKIFLNLTNTYIHTMYYIMIVLVIYTKQYIVLTFVSI